MDDLINSQEIEEQKEEQETVAQSLPYAGFWMRFWAFLLDGIIVFSLNSLFIYPVLRWQGLSGEQVLTLFTLDGVLTTVVGFVYFVLMTKYFQQTLGKRIIGLKVVSVQQSSLSWSTVIFREVIGRFIHHAFFIMTALYLTVAFSAKKQGIHDRIADTSVILEKR